MAVQRDPTVTSAGPADPLDEQRPIDESEVEIDLEQPLDAPIETPIVDALDQRHPEPLVDDEHEVS